MIIAIAGKGGTGKTTVAALLVNHLVHTGRRPVLAVDADPDSNLPHALGIAPEKSLSTIGRARQEFFDSKGDVPAGMPKEAYLELKLNQSLIETKDIDLLVMGRPEGSGCYCYINNVLRKHLEGLTKNYPFTIIDNEAGLEHLSRRTAQTVDDLIVVSDYSMNGLRAALHVDSLATEMELAVTRRWLVVNNVPDPIPEQFQRAIDDTGLNLLGCIPRDPDIPRLDIENRPLCMLPDNSPARAAFGTLAGKLFDGAA